jgi:hypothetical protein
VRPIGRLEVESHLDRITQEALNNVSTHARASRVNVRLERRSQTTVLVIEDNGLGFNPAATPRGTIHGGACSACRSAPRHVQNPLARVRELTRSGFAISRSPGNGSRRPARRSRRELDRHARPWHAVGSVAADGARVRD